MWEENFYHGKLHLKKSVIKLDVWKLPPKKLSKFDKSYAITIDHKPPLL